MKAIRNCNNIILPHMDCLCEGLADLGLEVTEVELECLGICMISKYQLVLVILILTFNSFLNLNSCLCLSSIFSSLFDFTWEIFEGNSAYLRASLDSAYSSYSIEKILHCTCNNTIANLVVSWEQKMKQEQLDENNLMLLVK